MSAFGPGGEGLLSLCFASTPDKLNEAMKALGKEIGRRKQKINYKREYFLLTALQENH